MNLISLYPSPLHPFRLAWQILYESGMRPMEVCTLKIWDVDFDECSLNHNIYKKPKKKLKDGTEVKQVGRRKIPITRDLLERLKGFIWENRGSFLNGYLFIAPSLQSKYPHMNPRCLNWEMDKHREILGGRWLERIGNGNNDHLLGPHSFRRGWITRYIDRYNNPAECARAIGHNSMDVTFQYYKKVDVERLKEFVNADNIFMKNPTITPDQKKLKEWF